jgi:hypothetical protein
MPDIKHKRPKRARAKKIEINVDNVWIGAKTGADMNAYYTAPKNRKHRRARRAIRHTAYLCLATAAAFAGSAIITIIALQLINQ